MKTPIKKVEGATRIQEISYYGESMKISLLNGGAREWAEIG
jgi:hypothetical protein